MACFLKEEGLCRRSTHNTRRLALLKWEVMPGTKSTKGNKQDWGAGGAHSSGLLDVQGRRRRCGGRWLQVQEQTQRLPDGRAPATPQRRKGTWKCDTP